MNTNDIKSIFKSVVRQILSSLLLTFSFTGPSEQVLPGGSLSKSQVFGTLIRAVTEYQALYYQYLLKMAHLSLVARHYPFTLNL